MEACDAEGEYADEIGLAGCKSAPAGMQPTENRSAVTLCPAGRYSGGGRTTCEKCASGAWSARGSAACTRCNLCSPGTVMVEACSEKSDTICRECGIGEASPGRETLECTKCDREGLYSDEKLASSCKTVGAGKRPLENRTGVVDCEKDTFSVGANDTCTNCSEGGYSKPGSSACDICSPGRYFNEAAYACQDCDAGKYSETGATDVSGCHLCDEVLISEKGSVSCKACPQYELPLASDRSKCDCGVSFVREEGIVDEGSGDDEDSNPCTCEPGKMLIGTACVECDTGKFKEEFGIQACTLCSAIILGSTTTGSGAKSEKECICPMGTCMDSEQETETQVVVSECRTIVDGMIAQKQGMDLFNVQIEKGFWRIGEDSWDVRECPVSDACLGGNSTEGYCREGHNGPYCILCEDGFSADVFGLCQKCNLGHEAVLTTLGVGVGVSLLCVGAYVLWEYALRGKRTLKRQLTTGIKTMFVTYQILAALPSVIPEMALPDDFMAFLGSLSFLNFNVVEFASE